MACTTKQTKRVSFGDVSEHEATEQHSFTEDQMKVMWYNHGELKAMKKHVKRILLKKVALNTSVDCWRGLEAFENSSRSIRSKKAIQPVLRLQAINAEAGVCDSNGIRSFAVSINQRSTQEGIRRASQDVMEAFEVYQETMGVKQVANYFGKNATTRVGRCAPRTKRKSKQATARTA